MGAGKRLGYPHRYSNKCNLLKKAIPSSFYCINAFAKLSGRGFSYEKGNRSYREGEWEIGDNEI